MPTYIYECSDEKKSCEYCRPSFEIVQKMKDEPLKVCPKCSNPIRKVYTPIGMGYSNSKFDDKAKSAGFHKWKKLSKGEYEKDY